MSRKRTKKTKSTRASRHLGYSKVRARTERMNMSVRLAFCILVLMGCLAFFATVLQPYNELKDRRKDLAAITEDEELKVHELDFKKLELELLEKYPEYRKLRARGTSPYSKPGERIYRFER